MDEELTDYIEGVECRLETYERFMRDEIDQVYEYVTESMVHHRTEVSKSMGTLNTKVNWVMGFVIVTNIVLSIALAVK